MSKPLPSILKAPWAITPGGLETVLAIVSRDEFFADVRERALAAQAGKPMANDRQPYLAGGVAVIPVTGALFRHASMMTEVSGGTSYGEIRKDLNAALANPAVKSIMLAVDSPGGEVTGCNELSDAIYAARAVKPITAYVEGTGASAAYWLASAADEIVCSATSELGSIGVRVAMIDSKKADEAAGKRTIDFVSSVSPNKVLDYDDDEDCALLQARVDATAEVFVHSVARNRGILDDDVTSRYGRGDVLVGKYAVAAGLADRLGSFDDLLSEMTAKNGEKKMESIFAALAMTGATEQQGFARVMQLVSAEKELLAATGSETVTEAMAAVQGWKIAAAKSVEIQEKLAKQEAAALMAEFDATIEAAMVAGKITPAPNDEARAYAETLRGTPNCVDALKKFVKVLPAKVPTRASTEPATADSVVTIEADEKKMMKAMGITAEDYIKNKARRLAMAPSPQISDEE